VVTNVRRNVVGKIWSVLKSKNGVVLYSVFDDAPWTYYCYYNAVYIWVYVLLSVM
jgi:hypothetical protein